MKYVSLAAVVKFDDMYAAALHDNAIQAAVGCKLMVTNKREDRYNRARALKANDGNYTQGDSIQSAEPLSENEQKVQDIKDHCFMKFLRIIHKLYRLYFISLAFYFMPLGALLLSFMVNRPRNEGAS